MTSVAPPKNEAWADVEEEDTSTPTVTKNPDGTSTVVFYRMSEDGKKIRVTQKVKEVTIKEKVNKAVAERKHWAKYGEEKGSAAGPNMGTTSLDAPITLKLHSSLKLAEKEEAEKAEEEKARARAAGKGGNLCRVCKGPHFTYQCPFKDKFKDVEETTSPMPTEEIKSGKYVPPSLRNGGAGTSMFDREEGCTIKVSNINADADEDIIRAELFSKVDARRMDPFRRGSGVRIKLIRNRETGESKGLAYITLPDQKTAEHYVELLHGKGYHNMILHVEIAPNSKR